MASLDRCIEDGKARSDESGAQFWALLKEESIASTDSQRGSTPDDPLMRDNDELSADFDSAGKTEMVKTFDSMILLFEYNPNTLLPMYCTIIYVYFFHIAGFASQKILLIVYASYKTEADLLVSCSTRACATSLIASVRYSYG